jgi:hypothetical protein
MPSPSLPSRDDLTSLDLMVLEALTTSRVTASTVTLASTVWTDWGDQWGADPVGLVEFVVKGLAERNLVTYRIHESRAGPDPRPYAGMPYAIRLTHIGWALMGYGTVHAHVGHMSRHTRDAAAHQGDMTNYRNHREHAEGVGPIETLSFPEHRAKYPAHVHPLMENDMDIAVSPGLAPLDEAKRAYVKVTPELEAKVVAYRTRFPLVDYAELARITDLPERTIKYILADLPRLRAVNDAEGKVGSIKQRIMWTLAALDMKNVPELRRVLGRNDTEHDIVHALHDLHTQGKVDFREDGRHKYPVDIHLTKRGRGEGLGKKVTDAVEAAAHEADAAVAAIEGPAPAEQVEAEPVPTEAEPAQEYPLLAALIEREQERVNRDNVYFKYAEAADLIRETDPETAALLDRKAQENDLPIPSPIESEYLRFYRNTPMKLVPRE